MSASEHLVTTIEQLVAIYGEKKPSSVVKEIDHVNGSYRKLIDFLKNDHDAKLYLFLHSYEV